MAGQIAQLVVPADGGGNPKTIATDWARGRVYFVSDKALRSYQTILTTQSPMASSLAYSSTILGADVDPVSGALLVNRPQEGNPVFNGDPLYKYDQNTFAVIGSFGATATSIPSWPTSFWGTNVVVCAGCGTLASGGATQVGYAFLKAVANGNVGIARVDTMQQAGFHQAVVSGGSGGKGSMCRAASGPGGASVFLSWDANTAASPTVPLYKVTISPGAETYNSASWPAINPHIASSTVGMIAAASVDPSWVHLQCISLGYDATDGNALMVVSTTDAVAHTRYLIKVNATTAAVIWATSLPAVTMIEDPGLSGYSVAHNTIGLIGHPESALVAANTGTLTSAAFGGLTWGTFTLHVGSQFGAGSVASDTAALYLVSVGSYDSTAADAPVPVAGTPGSFSFGYALIGGLIPPPPAVIGGKLAMDNVRCEAVSVLPCTICLDWSNDRGHTFGNPVCQPFGDFLTSLQWQRLGMARDRVFRLTWTCAEHTALQGAWVTAITGDEDNEMKGGD